MDPSVADSTDVGEIILGKKNPGINYLLHIESNESKRIPYGTRENSEFENNLRQQ